jgi:hypothetical protein
MLHGLTLAVRSLCSCDTFAFNIFIACRPPECPSHPSRDTRMAYQVRPHICAEPTAAAFRVMQIQHGSIFSSNSLVLQTTSVWLPWLRQDTSRLRSREGMRAQLHQHQRA